MLYEWHFLSKHKESAASNFVSTLQSDIMCCQSQQKLNHREGCIFMSWLLCDKNLHTNCTYYINVLPLHGNKQPLIHTLLDNTFFAFSYVPWDENNMTHLYNYIFVRMSTAVEDPGLSYYTRGSFFMHLCCVIVLSEYYGKHAYINILTSVVLGSICGKHPSNKGFTI